MPIKFDKNDEVRPVMLKAKQYYVNLLKAKGKPFRSKISTAKYIGCNLDTIYRWFRILKNNSLF